VLGLIELIEGIVFFSLIFVINAQPSTPAVRSSLSPGVELAANRGVGVGTIS